MSAIEVKEIIYHCQCRRFAEGTPFFPCTCPECGREHLPTDDSGSAMIPATRGYISGNTEKGISYGDEQGGGNRR